jgi:SOS-response transcriptional repressor LexA
MPQVQACSRTAGPRTARRDATGALHVSTARTFDPETGRTTRRASAVIVQLSKPAADGIVELLEMTGLGPLGADAFALHVDGDSMAPRIRDGDMLVCRRSVAPQPGQIAVVRVRGYVGQAVKIWRPEGDDICLISINESYPPRRVARTDILWACRVLYVVRP